MITLLDYGAGNVRSVINAIESLEMGLDFILDDPKMERDFYDQLQKAYILKGNSKKANEYAKKMTQLNIPN